MTNSCRHSCSRLEVGQWSEDLGGNLGSDRSQLANVANGARAVLQTDKLDAVADRGCFNGFEILACDRAGIAVTLPKPMTFAAISWHFERDPIPYALETAELHPASTGFRRRSGAPLIRDAQVRVPPPGLRVLANSDSNMQRFESRRLNRPVRLKRVKYEGRSKTARYREVSQT